MPSPTPPRRHRKRDEIRFAITLTGIDARKWRALTWAFGMTDEQLLAACLETVFGSFAGVGPER